MASNSTVGELKIVLSFDTKEYDKGVKTAEKETKKFSEIARETIIANIVNGAFNKVTEAISGLIGKVSDFAASTVEIGKNFDTSMSNVAAVSGAVGDELMALRDKAKEMGAATKFTATEAADAMSYMAMAGWKTEDMLNGVKGVMDLAAASGADLATTSDIVTDALTAFGLSAQESGRLADVMAAASSNANTNVVMMGETFKYAAPIAGALGYSIEDTAVAIGMMANAGIKGSQAGTSLRSMMTRLASPTSEVKDAMSALGISITNTDGSMKPLNTVMKDLRKSFDGLGEAQQAEYAKMLAGQEAMSGLLAIVNGADQDFNKLTAAVEGSSGAAAKMAFTMIDNLAGAQELVNSKAESLKLTLYEGVEPALRAVTKASGAMLDALMGGDGSFEVLTLAGEELMTKFSEVANTLPTIIQDMASRIPQIIETIAPVFAEAVPMLANAFTGVIPAFIAAISQSLPTLTTTVITIVQSIITIFLNAIPQLLELGAQILITIVEGISKTIPELVSTISNLIPELAGVLIDQVPTLLNAAISLFLAIVEAIPKIVPQLLEALPEIIKTIVDSLLSNITVIIGATIDLLMGVVEAIPQILPPLIDALPDIINNIVNFLNESLPLVINGAVQLFMGIIQAIPTIITSLVGVLPTLINAVITVFTNPDTIMSLLNGAITMFYAVIDALPQIIEALSSALPDILTTIVDYLTNPATINTFLQAAITLFFALVDAVPRILGALLQSFGALVSNLWNGITAMFGKFAENFGSFISGAFKRAINGVLAFIEGFINSPIGVINGFIDVINGAFGAVGVNIGHIDTFSLPRMAQGGYADSATAAIFGEAGKEVALPLEHNTDNWSGLLAAALAEEFEMGEVALGNERPIQNTQNIIVNDQMDIRKVGNAFLQEIRRAA